MKKVLSEVSHERLQRYLNTIHHVLSGENAKQRSIKRNGKTKTKSQFLTTKKEIGGMSVQDVVKHADSAELAQKKMAKAEHPRKNKGSEVVAASDYESPYKRDQRLASIQRAMAANKKRKGDKPGEKRAKKSDQKGNRKAAKKLERWMANNARIKAAKDTVGRPRKGYEKKDQGQKMTKPQIVKRDDRAKHIRDKNPDLAKGAEYAIATQQILGRKMPHPGKGHGNPKYKKEAAMAENYQIDEGRLADMHNAAQDALRKKGQQIAAYIKSAPGKMKDAAVSAAKGAASSVASAAKEKFHQADRWYTGADEREKLNAQVAHKARKEAQFSKLTAQARNLGDQAKSHKLAATQHVTRHMAASNIASGAAQAAQRAGYTANMARPGQVTTQDTYARAKEAEGVVKRRGAEAAEYGAKAAGHLSAAQDNLMASRQKDSRSKRLSGHLEAIRAKAAGGNVKTLSFKARGHAQTSFQKRTVKRQHAPGRVGGVSFNPAG